MTTRDIVETFKEMYGADVSPTVISNVTDAVHEQIIEWQSRPLDPLYPIVYLDCIVVKIRKNRHVMNQSVYLALGVNTEGHKGYWGYGSKKPKVKILAARAHRASKSRR